jgi:hypothetical protein
LAFKAPYRGTKVTAFVTAGLLMISSCSAPSKITTEPVNARPTAAVSGLTPVGAARIDVRSFENVGVNGIRIKERSGAICTFNNPELTASVTTPAALNVPLFAGRTSALSYSCSYDGETVTGVLNCYLTGDDPSVCSYGDRATAIFKKP